MPPRIPTFTSLRQTLRLTQQTAPLSSTSRTSAFRSLPSTSSSTSNLLNLDTPPSPRKSNSHDALANMLRSSETSGRGWGSKRARAAADKPSTKEELRNREVSDKFSRMMPRFWKEGDVYAPQDLGAYEARKFRKTNRDRTGADVMDLLGVNPLDMYRNFSVIGDFITPFGRIKHNKETGLRLVNQRRMAKTIRRAIGLGIHPSVYRHPMILLKDRKGQ